MQDVADLYVSLAPALVRIVRAGVYAPEDVIEDACQFAWGRLVCHRHRVRRDTTLQWLSKTAVREALRIGRVTARELPLEDVERGSQEPCDLIEARDRLACVASLPVRQQRVIWMHAAGLSYAEIAAREGCTRRTVERQLLRARHRVRAAAGQ